MSGEFGAVAMVQLLVALLVIGCRRRRDAAALRGDPLVWRLGGLRTLPTYGTLSRWLGRFTMRTVARLQALNAAVVAQTLTTLGLATLTVDVGGTTVCTDLQVESAFRGLGPRHREVPSYCAILALVAKATRALPVNNASGRVHDSKAGLPFLRELWTQLILTMGCRGRVRFRMDGALFREDVIRLLQGRPVDYAVDVRFHQWFELRAVIRAQPTWLRVASDVTGFALGEVVTPWQVPVIVAIFREGVHHRSPKNHLDLFDARDGHDKHSDVTSNLGLSLPALWQSISGRGGHEKTIGELMHGLAFGSAPTAGCAAKSV